VTRLYDEITQSCLGSPWVTFFRVAGSAENLLRQLVPCNTTRTEIDLEEVPGPEASHSTVDGKRDSATGGCLEPLRLRSTRAKSRAIGRGTIDARHWEVWRETRIRVMHGELTSICSSEEDSAMGCDHLQGYLFSKPVSADDLVRLVRANHPQRAPRKSLVIAPA
jgi:hypothetical protein